MKLNPKGLIQFNESEAALIKRLKIINSACGGITVGAGYDCDDPLVAGVEQRLILINKDDFDDATVTYDVTTTTLITNIVLASGGKQGWAFQGIRRSLNPQATFVPAAVSVGYDHQINFLVFEITQIQKDNIEKLGLDKVVAVVQNINAAGNGDGVFEVFGKDVGLTMTEGTRINADQETNGAFNLILKTSDDLGKEPKLPTNYWDTNFATTLAKVDTLLVPTI